jgi:L-ectoine synthase
LKVIRISDLIGTDRQVDCPRGGFISYRALIAEDGMGFSLHATVIQPGDVQRWHYANHLEACYCLSGEGKLTSESSGESWVIGPNTLYVLDDHDPHTFEAFSTVVLVSVFNPPVTGQEVHDESGSYPIAEVRLDV